MLQKRVGPGEVVDENMLALAEAARLANNPPPPKAEEKKSSDENISLFWRVFGGTIISMVAIGSFTLFNSISGNIAELRAELNKEREARSALAKKDELDGRVTTLYERIRSFDSLKAEQEGSKERMNANANAIDGLKKDMTGNLESLRKEVATATEGAKKDAAAIELLKERVASFETAKKELAGLEPLKEKMNGALADLKFAREELIKVQQEIERNKAADLERKASRDGQFKQVEEMLKELQKGLQDCREKIARLEGAQPAPKTADPKGM